MRKIVRIQLVLLIFAFVSIPGFSQNTDPAVKKESDKRDDSSRNAGMRKVASGNRDVKLDIKLDELALQETIHSAVEDALRSVEGKLEGLAIHIAPIEIDLTRLNTLEPLIINIPRFDISIEPFMIELEDLEIDLDLDIDEMDEDDVAWMDKDDTELTDQSKMDKEKADKDRRKADQLKPAKDKTEKDKTKGLKKVN